MNSRRARELRLECCAPFGRERDEQAARGLRVVAERLERLRQSRPSSRALRRSRGSAGRRSSARLCARGRVRRRSPGSAPTRAGCRRRCGPRPRAHDRRARSPVTSVTAFGSSAAQHVGCILVQRAHPADRALELHVAREALLVAGHDQPGSERLRQEERVAGPRAVLRPDPVRPHGADDREPVLRLGVANRVPTRKQAAGGAHLLVRRGEDLARASPSAALPGTPRSRARAAACLPSRRRR